MIPAPLCAAPSLAADPWRSDPARILGITPEVPGWGIGRPLKEGESMIRYLILGKEPLDVVYSESGDVVVIYRSYE